MTRREAFAALIVLPAALMAVPPPQSKLVQLVMKIGASIAEFEKAMARLERAKRKLVIINAGNIVGNPDELSIQVLNAWEKGWRKS